MAYSNDFSQQSGSGGFGLGIGRFFAEFAAHFSGHDAASLSYFELSKLSDRELADIGVQPEMIADISEFEPDQP